MFYLRAFSICCAHFLSYSATHYPTMRPETGNFFLQRRIFFLFLRCCCKSKRFYYCMCDVRLVLIVLTHHRANNSQNREKTLNENRPHSLAFYLVRWLNYSNWINKFGCRFAKGLLKIAMVNALNVR